MLDNLLAPVGRSHWQRRACTAASFLRRRTPLGSTERLVKIYETFGASPLLRA